MCFRSPKKLHLAVPGLEGPWPDSSDSVAWSSRILILSRIKHGLNQSTAGLLLPVATGKSKAEETKWHPGASHRLRGLAAGVLMKTHIDIDT